MLAADRQTLTWPAVSGAARYDVSRGRLSDLITEGDATSLACFDDGVVGTSVVDAQRPSTMDGYYYLVRSEAGSVIDCRLSAWGVASESVAKACP